jgi:hypothetical protein
MAININANIELGSAQYLDARQSVKDLNTLLALNTNIIPNGFECYVEELDCKYKYHESYNDPSTGYWKISENGGEKKGEIITLEEYNELEINGLVEQDKNYYILTNEVIDFEDKSYSPTKPTIDGVIGEIVYNSKPIQDSYIGWIYTPTGWMGFGKIEEDENEYIPENSFTLIDGSVFTLSDGSIFLYADN